MTRMFGINTKNPNYLAKIVRLSGLRKHTNADRLQCISIEGSNVITDLTAQDGEVYVFFPVECAINKEFLAHTNSFEDKTLNADTEQRGFFNKHGRVRAIRLRGEKSEGYIIPVEKLFSWLSVEFDESMIETEFDTINDVLICEKYIPKTKKSNGQQRSRDKKLKRQSKIVDGQFRLSEDTAHLKRNIENINPEDVITISYKMHGCNTSIGRVLCKRKLSIRERIAKWLGVKVEETKYDLVYASRRVIKNEYADKKHNSFYSEDVWGAIAERYANVLGDGITMYGEIVGYVPNTETKIQKGYDYGLPKGHCELYVYRMTYTSTDGKVYECSTPQMQSYCAKHEINTTPVFFHGKAEEIVSYNNTEELKDWQARFLERLIEDFTEKDCFMCNDVVPEEGVVVVKERFDEFRPYKLKSFRFLARESEDLDNEEENLDDG